MKIEARLARLDFSLHYGQKLTAHELILHGPQEVIPITKWQVIAFQRVVDAHGVDIKTDCKTRNLILRYLTREFQDGFVRAAVAIGAQKEREAQK